MRIVGALMALAAPIVLVVELGMPRHDLSIAPLMLLLVGLLMYGLGRLAGSLARG